MRTKLLILTIAAMLSACNMHESVTGSYGQRIVTGQVVVANSDATGVEVTVLGTGMSATLGSDGHFTFIGVPDEVELSFRRADGIDTRLRVSNSSKPLAIELSGNTSRRRGVSPKDPGPAQQYEGVIREVSSDSLTVFDSHHNEVKIALTSTTLIRDGNKNLTAADLHVDDQVHVKALVINDVLTATQVIVQQQEGDDDDDDNNGGTTMTANGLVTATAGTTLTVLSQPKGEVAVQTDTNTIIRKQGQRITA
ncbi:MAG TPA: DUF5666 domain-containing protein, partial [Thermoanaerobaculia bacterium]|nr:DUF5666 domain-containing protein [Thermoanaerobaculia bacterium]